MVNELNIVFESIYNLTQFCFFIQIVYIPEYIKCLAIIYNINIFLHVVGELTIN